MENSFLEEFRKYLEDPKNVEKMKNHFQEIEDRKQRNVDRIKKMFTDQKSFNKLIKNIIDKHDDRWVDGCYKRGVMPHPWQLMYALFDLSEIEGKSCKPVDGFTDNFPSSIYAYKGWKFAVTHGQGSVCSIYYNKKLMYRD